MSNETIPGVMFAGLTALGASVLTVQNAVAQESPGQIEALQEVVVTAERRAELSQDVPISMTVFSGGFIRQYMNSPYEVANLTANYQFIGDSVLSPFVNSPSIRGIGPSDNTNPLASTSILTYYDGIAVDTPVGQSIPQWDLERIEVTRGPQGTLYGRNSMGGAVQYISAAPTDEFDGYGELTVGDFEMIRFEGAVSGPITDNVKARVSGLIYDRAGDVTNVFFHKKEGEKNWWAIKGIVDWQVTNDFNVQVKARHFEGESPQVLLNAAPAANLPANSLAWLAAIGSDPELSLRSNFERTESGLREPLLDLEATLVELDLNYDFGPTALTVIGGYLDSASPHSDSNDSSLPVAIANISAPTVADRWSAEARLTSETDHPFQWILGSYYQHTEDSFEVGADFTNSLRDADGDGLTRYNGDSPEDMFDGLNAVFPFNTIFLETFNSQELDTYAFFVHTDFDWTERFTTTQAVRYTHEKKDLVSTFQSFFEFPVSPGVQAGAPGQPAHADFVRFARLSAAERRQQAVAVIFDPNPLDADGNPIPSLATDEAEEITWRFAADYSVTDDALIYASVSKGFKGTLFAVITSPGMDVSADPETAIVYEIGAKTQWLDKRLQLNASVFRSDHKDFQTSLRQIGPTGTFITILDNLPKSEIVGGEIELQAVPFRNLFIVANLGVLDSEITEVSEGNELLLGNELPRAEDVNFNGLVRYDVATRLGTFSPQVSWRYRGEYWTSKFNNDFTGKLGNFWTADARLGYESQDGKLYGLLYLKNIFDEVKPIQNGATIPSVSSNSILNERRNWGLTVGYRF
jgi:iron complex outermembrane receptor protein